MGRQRNRPQMKEQKESPEKESNEMETRNLPDTEFKIIVIRMLKEHRGRVDELNQECKEIVNIKKPIKAIKK